MTVQQLESRCRTALNSGCGFMLVTLFLTHNRKRKLLISHNKGSQRNIHKGETTTDITRLCRHACAQFVSFPVL